MVHPHGAARRRPILRFGIARIFLPFNRLTCRHVGAFWMDFEALGRRVQAGTGFPLSGISAAFAGGLSDLSVSIPGYAGSGLC
jgi:hypothetical protein